MKKIFFAIAVALGAGVLTSCEEQEQIIPTFVVNTEDEVVSLEYGMSTQLLVASNNVARYSITEPLGWEASVKDSLLTITAPMKGEDGYEKEGTISISAISATGASVVAQVKVFAGEWVDDVVLRTLTFEDEDAKFSPFALYQGAEIKTWSDLVDNPQYGGPLTYTDYMTDTYRWYDEGNTELYHEFMTPYWGGGHAVSNYALADYQHLPEGYYGWYELQLTTPMGGNNGSANFCVHNGYVDFFNSQIYEATLQGFAFADGVERVVDHMYVTNTNYVLNSLTYGDGFNAPATESTVLKVVAYGYNANDELVGETELTLCDGPQNILNEWKKWDLSSLGKVARVVFNFSASEDQIGSYGLNTPAYFAYDDVAVQFTEKVFK